MGRSDRLVELDADAGGRLRRILARQLPAGLCGRYVLQPSGELRAYAPQNGHFTRLWMRIKYHGKWRASVAKLMQSHGYWYWG